MKSAENKQRAFAVIEYVMLISIMILGLVAFQPYIQRAMHGQYRKAGESFAFGRQYSGSATIQCAYDDQADVWYSVECFNNEVLKTTPPCKNQADYFSCAHAVMHACASSCN